MDGGTSECTPVDMWSDMACVLEDWAPPRGWEGVEVTPEAAGQALGIVSRPFEKQSARQAAGAMASFFGTVLRKAAGRKTPSCRKHEKRARDLSCEVPLWR